ncbi:MAG: polyamine aminopropyltransferase [Candidatus Saelkia tenebricola]|nr:polyamine aminopropyltransferase [Candidatus Saelkia tenebricola]
MVNKWFSESLYPDIKLQLKVKKTLYSSNSSSQKVQFIETDRLGKILTLDGVIQTTTADEFIYHEMMAHVPLFSHPNPEQVLIIGGGDGGILREVLKHKGIKKITLVEIEKKVIDCSKKYLKQICSNSFQSKKLELIITDGAEFIKNRTNLYDVAIIDSTDPVGPAKVLFEDKFNRNVSNILKKNGIMVRQSGSSFLQKDELKENFNKSAKIFKHTSVYTASIPTYIGGLFSLIFSSNTINPNKFNKNTLKNRFAKLSLKTKYYNSEIHTACFKLPNYIKNIIGEKL